MNVIPAALSRRYRGVPTAHQSPVASYGSPHLRLTWYSYNDSAACYYPLAHEMHLNRGGFNVNDRQRAHKNRDGGEKKGVCAVLKIQGGSGTSL